MTVTWNSSLLSITICRVPSTFYLITISQDSSLSLSPAQTLAQLPSWRSAVDLGTQTTAPALHQFANEQNRTWHMYILISTSFTTHLWGAFPWAPLLSRGPLHWVPIRSVSVPQGSHCGNAMLLINPKLLFNETCVSSLRDLYLLFAHNIWIAPPTLLSLSSQFIKHWYLPFEITY